MTEPATREAGCVGGVFLLTDYGLADEFAGLLRAAVVRLAPDAPIVDLTHDIAPYDVVAGARALARCVDHLGPGVVVGVVDPGVGTDRRPVAVETRSEHGPRYLVGPDNGLLLPAADRLGGVRRAVVLPRAATSTTFDGRDVFAPAAARLWSGVDLGSLGQPVDPASLVTLAPPAAAVSDGAVATEVQWVDRFGNAQLAVGPAALEAAHLEGLDVLAVHLPARAEGRAGTSGAASGRVVTVRRVVAFADVTSGFGLVVDASGQLALVADRRSAAAELGLDVGSAVALRRPEGSRGRSGGGDTW